MTETNDGFKLAEVDLQNVVWRFSWHKAAGTIDLKMAACDTVDQTDQELAIKLLDNGPLSLEHQDVKAAVAAFWPQADGAEM